MKRLLLFSNSTNHGQGYLEHALEEMKEFLGDSVKTVLFVPFALKDHAGYTDAARKAFATIGCDVISAHEEDNLDILFEKADAIFIGGGNTFRLLKTMYARGLVERIRAEVASGMPYMGASAGSNVATLNIKTTNDMPIVEPPTFDALQLVSFNLNPHYLDPIEGSTHMGETRQKRIEEFLEENDNVVIGVREGGWLRVVDDSIILKGNTARVFYPNGEIKEFERGANLSDLL